MVCVPYIKCKKEPSPPVASTVNHVVRKKYQNVKNSSKIETNSQLLKLKVMELDAKPFKIQLQNFGKSLFFQFLIFDENCQSFRPSLSFEIFQTPICEIVELDMMRASTKQTLPKIFTVTVMT